MRPSKAGGLTAAAAGAQGLPLGTRPGGEVAASKYWCRPLFWKTLDQEYADGTAVWAAGLINK